jgi:hypothetical protein
LIRDDLGLPRIKLKQTKKEMEAYNNKKVILDRGTEPDRMY